MTSSSHPCLAYGGRLARVWLAAAAALVASPVQALEGRVLAPDGTPLQAARVTVLGRAGSVVSDAAGRFRLTPDPSPPFTLFVTRPDGVALAPVTFGALPPSGEVLEIRLQPVLSEAVTVISGIVPDLELPPAAAATVLGRGDLAQRTPDNLAGALAQVPGTAPASGQLDAVPSLRGLSKHRTLILLDHGRVTAERRAGASASFLDPLTVEEIEVVRGPGSVAYGSDAFGGVIRARSRMPRPGDPPHLRWAALGATGAGEWGLLAEGSGDLLGGAVLAGVHARSWDDYDAPAGTVPNSSGELRGARLAFQDELGGGVLSLSWRTDLGRDVGKAAADSDVVRAYYPEETSHRFGLGYEHPGPAGWSRVAVSAAWDSYGLQTARDRLATPSAVRQLALADVDAQDWGLRVEGERLLGATRLIVGVDGSGRFDLEAVNTTTVFNGGSCCGEATREVSIADAHREDLALFAAVTRGLGRVTLSGGLRTDRVTSANRGGYFGDRSSSHTALSGFAAASLPLGPGLELSAQLAHGFRDALLSDRYYRGITGRGFITGNPDLEPEQALQLDLALRYTSGPWQVAGFAYAYRIDDLIERYRTGADFAFRNRGEADIRGLELEATAELPRNLLLQVGAQLLDGEADDGSPLDDVPPRGVFVTLRRPPEHRWSWLVRAAAYARDEDPGPTELVTPGFTTIDAAVAYRLASGIELQLQGRNLLDHEHLATAADDAVPAPGRSLQLAVRHGWGRAPR